MDKFKSYAIVALTSVPERIAKSTSVSASSFLLIVHVGHCIPDIVNLAISAPSAMTAKRNTLIG